MHQLVTLTIAGSNPVGIAYNSYMDIVMKFVSIDIKFWVDDSYPLDQWIESLKKTIENEFSEIEPPEVVSAHCEWDDDD